MPPTPHPSGYAHITDDNNRLLLLKEDGGRWRLPGGPAIAGESARDATTYYVRRDLRIRVTPRFVLDMDLQGARTAYLFACGTLLPDEAAQIKLPCSVSSTVVAWAFTDPADLVDHIAPDETRLLRTAIRVLKGTDRA
ncbi:NUDIX hydrolase [Streptomyces sp. I05A-00742]|uniref:NUDIX hydrolase n=1 Tax=Streptomyces sp. I05A-00742 TaxID=2732853 RepID=UPI00148789E7|nr:NUDIX hydrolase [Streptomyces sp. I05A-00742]